MFKELFKSTNGKWIFVIVLVLFILWALMSYTNSKQLFMDNYEDYSGSSLSSSSSKLSNYAPVNSVQPTVQKAKVQPSVMSNAVNVTSNPNTYAQQPVANPSDLLPQDKNSQWAALNPINNGNPIIPDLLQAGNLIGLDTIGQTLKNANLQLRSDPVISKMNVGPWNNSTYEADLGRVPLELGCGQP